MSASVPQSTRWSEVDELALQHFARPEAYCQSLRSATASGQHAPYCMSTTAALSLPANSVASPDGLFRSFSLSQTPTSTVHFATRTPLRANGSQKTLPSRKSSKHSCADKRHDRSCVPSATCIIAFEHSAPWHHASPTRYPSHTMLRVIDTTLSPPLEYPDLAFPARITQGGDVLGGTIPHIHYFLGCASLGLFRLPLFLHPLCWSHFLKSICTFPFGT